MSQDQKYDCKDCKHNKSDICTDCQVTDEGIPTRFEAKEQNIDMHWLSLLFLTAAAFQQDSVKEKLGELKIENYKEKIEEMERELRERQNDLISKPEGCFTSYYPMNFVPCFRETPSYQRDCYYFSEEQDMSARIPSCDRIPGIEGYEPKNCNKNCPYYISKSHANKLINDYVEGKNEK